MLTAGGNKMILLTQKVLLYHDYRSPEWNGNKKISTATDMMRETTSPTALRYSFF